MFYKNDFLCYNLLPQDNVYIDKSFHTGIFCVRGLLKKTDYFRVHFFINYDLFRNKIFLILFSFDQNIPNIGFFTKFHYKILKIFKKSQFWPFLTPNFQKYLKNMIFFY
jgi:hypothetical protein